MADFRHFSTGIDGTETHIKIERRSDGKKDVIVRQIIPPTICNQIFAENEFRQSEAPIGKTARGSTQRHMVPVAQMPQALFYQLIQKLGPPWDEGSRKNWRNWLNDPANRAWRQALGTV